MAGTTNHTRTDGRPLLGVFVFRLIGYLAVTALLSGCASTVTVIRSDGTKVEARSGFGNRIQVESCSIEPSSEAVQAAERVGVLAVTKASEAVLLRMVDTVTSATRG
jgi:hypothetical protein